MRGFDLGSYGVEQSLGKGTVKGSGMAGGIIEMESCGLLTVGLQAT